MSRRTALSNRTARSRCMERTRRTAVPPMAGPVRLPGGIGPAPGGDVTFWMTPPVTPAVHLNFTNERPGSAS